MKIHISSEESTPGSGPSDTRTTDRWVEERVTSRPSAVSYRETPTTLELEVEMPGADPKALEVTLKGRRLTVSFERKQETRTPGEGRERVETLKERLTKEIDLPTDADPGNTDAVYRGGKLHLVMAKKTPDDGQPARRVRVG